MKIFVRVIFIFFSFFIAQATFGAKNHGYSTLYYPQEVPTIIGFEKPQRDKLMIILSASISGNWYVVPDEGQSYQVAGNYPILRLLNRVHTYKIVSTSSARLPFQFTMKIDYVRREVYAAAKNSTPDVYQVVYASIPIGMFQQYPIESLVDYNSKQEKKKARRILEKKAGIDWDSGIKSRIEQVAIFLLNQLDTKRGIPSDEMMAASPLQQYQLALSGKSGIWCSNFMQIYSLFANAAEIPTRSVRVGGSLDAVSLSGHGFSESFIPKSNRWVFVDLNSKKIFLTNSQGDFLNTLDLFYINLVKAYEGIHANVFHNGKVSKVPYSTIAQSEAYYFGKDVTFVFQGKKQIKITPLR